jgi:hypothetical protein
MGLLNKLTMIQSSLYALLDITPVQPSPLLKVNILLDRKEYIKIAQRFGVPGNLADGFCDTNTLEMFILLKPKWLGYDNIATLFHEFTHLVLIDRLIYPDIQRAVRPFPFWFTEGMACYAEAVSFVNGKAIFGQKNTPRLNLLRSFIDSQQSIWNSPIFSSDYAKGFSLNDYALAWGLIAYIMSSADLRSQAARFIKSYPVDLPNDHCKLFRSYFVANDYALGQWQSDFFAWIARAKKT